MSRPLHPWSLWGVLLAPLAFAGPAERPAPDPSAIRDAVRAAQESGEDFASSSSYLHFLRARLLHHSGEHRSALDELQLALVTDPGNPFLGVALAEEYARTGDLARAERTLRRVTDAHPTYAPAYLMAGRVLSEAGKADRARALLKKAVKLQPRLADGWLALAQLELDHGQPDAALAAVDRMAAALPQDPRGFRMLGSAFLDRGDAGRAERALRRAVQISETEYDAWSLLAQIYERSERPALAEEAWARALAQDPENVEVLLAGGRAALRMGADARARTWFERVLSLSDEPEIAVRVSFAYLSSERAEDAAEILDRARRKGSREPRLGYYAGLVHEKLRRFDRAAAAYAEVPPASELYVEAQVRRGTALSLAGDHPRALGGFRRLIEERPEETAPQRAYARALERSGALKQAERVLRRALQKERAPDLYEALAQNLQRQGRGQEAVRLLEDALAARPRDGTLRFLLGAAHERHGNVDHSLWHLRAALEGDPDNATLLNFIGYVLADHGRDYDEAERLVRRALEIRPNTAAYLDSLGWVHFRRGQMGEAVRLLEQAAALDPDEPVIIDHLGDAYRSADRKAEAARTYRRALEALQRADDPLDARGLKARLESKLKALSTDSAGR